MFTLKVFGFLKTFKRSDQSFMSFLRVEKLSKLYGYQNWALRDVSFEMSKGEIFGVFGASGSGKSALFEILSGGERDFNGSFEFSEAVKTISCGNSVRTPKSLRDKFRMAFSQTARTPIDSAMIEYFDIKDLAEKDFQAFSSGEKQLWQTVSVFAQKPPFIILDEPLTNLDDNRTEILLKRLREFTKENYLTVICAFSNVEDIFGFCDRVMVLEKGAVEQTGTPREIYFEPENRYVAEHFGRTNIIEARRLTKSTNRLQEFVSVIGEQKIFTDTDELARLGAINRNVFLSIRPEDVAMYFGAVFPEDNLLKATVKEVVKLGATTRICLDVNGLTLEALLLRSAELEVGEECIVGLPPNKIRILKD